MKTTALLVLVALLGDALASAMDGTSSVPYRVGRISRQSCLPPNMASRTVGVNDASRCASVCSEDAQCLSFTTVNNTNTCYLFYFGADTYFTSLDKTTPGLACVDYTYPQRASASLNACSNQQCQNGARCLVDSLDPDGYRCQCVQQQGREYRGKYCDTWQTNALVLFKRIKLSPISMFDAKHLRIGARQFLVVAATTSENAVVVYEIDANDQIRFYTSIYETYYDQKGMLQVYQGSGKTYLVASYLTNLYENGYSRLFRFQPTDIAINATSCSAAALSTLPHDGSGNVAPVSVNGAPLYQAIAQGLSVVVINQQTQAVESVNTFDTSVSSTAFVSFINAVSTNRAVVITAVGAAFGGCDSTCVTAINSVGGSLALPLNATQLYVLVGFKKPYSNYDPVQSAQQTAAQSAGSLTLVKTIGSGVTYVNQMTEYNTGGLNDLCPFSDGQVWYAAIFSNTLYLRRMVSGAFTHFTSLGAPAGASFTGDVALQEVFGEKVAIVANNNQFGSIYYYRYVNDTTWTLQGTAATNMKYAYSVDTFELNKTPYVVVAEQDSSMTTYSFLYTYRWQKLSGVLSLSPVTKTKVPINVGVGLAVSVFGQNAYILITHNGALPHQLYQFTLGTSGVGRLWLVNPSQSQIYNIMTHAEMFVRNNQLNVVLAGTSFPNATSAQEAAWLVLN